MYHITWQIGEKMIAGMILVCFCVFCLLFRFVGILQSFLVTGIIFSSFSSAYLLVTVTKVKYKIDIINEKSEQQVDNHEH